MEMILLGQRIDGAKAAEIGLVNRAVPRVELDETALKFADALAAKPAVAVRAAKALVRSGAELPLAAALDRELDTLLALMDHKKATS
jgi:enoyl-CoA hydratase/carnithine racemase